MDLGYLRAYIKNTRECEYVGTMGNIGNMGNLENRILLDNWIICEIGIFGYELHGTDEIAYNWKFVIEAN